VQIFGFYQSILFDVISCPSTNLFSHCICFSLKAKFSEEKNNLQVEYKINLIFLHTYIYISIYIYILLFFPTKFTVFSNGNNFMTVQKEAKISEILTAYVFY